jgi:hypothetical protein
LIGRAQQAAAVPRESSQVKALVESAREAAGDEWAEAFASYCATDQRRANRADDPVIQPAQLNHPLMDGTAAKLARRQTRKPGGPHPFVVGTSSYQRFLNESSDCLKAVLARRAEARAASPKT